ncbi:MAG: hypothetical protein ABIH26_09820 [Candidatus Eisenbacteria bacterium]
MRKEAAAVALAVLSILTAGCAENAFEPRENVPPETGLAITGDSLSATIYEVNLKWWGSDTDGEVAGFEYKWTAPPGAETYDLETGWTYTAFVKKTFLLPVPDSLSSYRFDVRSVDDRGLADPSPAWQEYPFYNNRPATKIRFRELLPDSAWPVLAFGWESTDPEGDSTIARHLVWVKGREGVPVEIPGDADTVLLLPADIDTFGAVTFYMQAVDEAHSASIPDSFDVFLHRIRGRVLLVDDFPIEPTSVVNPDAFYRNALNTRLGSDAYTLLDLRRIPFDTGLRFAGFLTAFDHVVWYTGNRQRSTLQDEQRFTQMTRADSGLGVFLERGGSLFMESLNAVGTFGGLLPGFPSKYMGFDQLYVNRATGGTNFEFLPAVPPVPRPCEVPFRAVEGTGLPDLFLRCPIQYPGLDSPLDTTAGFVAERLYRVPAGTFKNQPWDFYPAVRHDLPGPGGKAVLCTFPFSLYYGDPGNNDEAFGAFLDWLGCP